MTMNAPDAYRSNLGLHTWETRDGTVQSSREAAIVAMRAARGSNPSLKEVRL